MAVETIIDLKGNVIVADEFRAPGAGGSAATQTFVFTETKTKTETVALTNASVAHALNATFSDTEVEAALNALGAKINTIIAALKA